MRHKSSFLTETAKRWDKRLGGGKAGRRGGWERQKGKGQGERIKD
jgi:hypothetical protein